MDSWNKEKKSVKICLRRRTCAKFTNKNYDYKVISVQQCKDSPFQISNNNFV